MLSINSQNLHRCSTRPMYFCGIVAAGGPTIWTSTYGLEPMHCNRLLVEPSCWSRTVHTSTLLSYSYALCWMRFSVHLSVSVFATPRRFACVFFSFFINSRRAVSVPVVRKINRPFSRSQRCECISDEKDQSPLVLRVGNCCRFTC